MAGRATTLLTSVLMAGALLVGCGSQAQPSATPPPSTATAPVAATAAPAPPTPAAAVSPTAAPTAQPATPRVTDVGLPVRLKIAAIGVDAAVERVGLDNENAMDVPQDPHNTAWYQYGPRPGQPGNAVIAGHVDYQGLGPVVFARLDQLKQGDEVVVVDEHGVERRFAVTGIETYPRRDAPVDKIFGPAIGEALVLITCDKESTFDRGRREYRNNIVVYAEAKR